jgi:hypothetical protein
MRFIPASSTIVLAAVGLALMSAGCDAVGDPEEEGKEASTDEIESDTAAAETMRRDCTLGCPEGWHPTGYYCTTCGSNVVCTSSYNSTVCEKDELPQYATCVLGCPPGYHHDDSFCDQDCVGAPGLICGANTGHNASHCSAIVTIGGVTDPQGQPNIRVGQPISIWGTNFNPNGSSVVIEQFATNNPNSRQVWGLPQDDDSYWWNGNTTQINTIVPHAILAHRPFTVRVSSGTNLSEARVVSVTP